MSSEDIGKRIRIIQKLDFENCIVTNIKTRARGRKKLRARISREIAVSKDTKLQEKSASLSPVLTQKTHSEDAKPTSPVLIKNQRKNCSSPVFFKRKKSDSQEKGTKNSSESLTIEEVSSSPPRSPVFRTFKKYKLEDISLNSSEDSKRVSERTPTIDVFNSQEISDSDWQSSFQIEDFTQESKQSVKISSVDSTEAKKNNLSDYSVEQNHAELNTVWQNSPAELSCSFTAREKPSKRHYKKNSLLSRLHKLQKKQASEKLLWQHQNRKKLTGSLKVSIVNFWKEDFNYFINCQSILSDFEKTLLIVDCRWVPNVKKIKENSVLQLHPPWQKLIVEESMMTVLLNVICLEILDETREPIRQKRTLESVPTNIFETDNKLFTDSLFFSCGSGYLC